MENRVTEECLSIFNVNGSFRKVQKSKMLEKLSMQTITKPTPYTALVDMGLIWRIASPNTEDREKDDGLKYTWGDYSDKIVSIVLFRHVDADTIICINDPYDQSYCIKDDERDLRSQLQGVIPNVYMKRSEPFPLAKHFKTLLCSGANKMRLQELIKTAFCTAAQDTEKKLLYSVGSICIDTKSGQSMDEFTFDQAEADTILLSAYNKLRITGYDGPVMIE